MFYCIATKGDRFTVSTYSLISGSYIGLGGRTCTFCLFTFCCHPVCVANMVCDAGTLSLWSLECHWHTMPNSRYSSSCCFLVLTVTDLVCLLARHLITPVRILGWWELKVMQLSVCISFKMTNQGVILKENAH